MSDTLDLSASVSLESATLNFRLPGTQKLSGWKIELAGPQHPETIALVNDVWRENLEVEHAIAAAQAAGRKYTPEVETPEDRRRRNVNKVCRRIIGWSPNPVFKNFSESAIVFSVANATELFLRPDMGGYFVQITDYINGERAFLQPSETL